MDSNFMLIKVPVNRFSQRMFASSISALLIYIFILIYSVKSNIPINEFWYTIPIAFFINYVIFSFRKFLNSLSAKEIVQSKKKLKKYDAHTLVGKNKTIVFIYKNIENKCDLATSTLENIDNQFDNFIRLIFCMDFIYPCLVFTFLFASNIVLTIVTTIVFASIIANIIKIIGYDKYNI